MSRVSDTDNNNDKVTSKPDDQNNEEPEFKEDQGDETGDKGLETFYTFKWINKHFN